MIIWIAVTEMLLDILDGKANMKNNYF